MSVSLNPSSNLGFKRPLTQLVKRSLTITNNNAQPIAFKVKTTAPKLYCVRPNSGRVEPGGSQEVSVMLQAMKEEPPLNAKCKDKFLIQSTIITPDKEALPLSEIWATTDSSGEGQVYQQKLRVSYLPAEGQTLEEEDETAAGMTSILSDANAYETVSQHPVNGAPSIPSAFAAPAVTKPVEEVPPRPETPPQPIVEETRAPPPAPATIPEPVQAQPELPTIREPSIRAPSPAPVAPAPAPVAPEPTPVVVAPPVQHVPAPAPVFEEPKPRAPAPAPVRAPEPVQAPAPAPIVITKENPLNQQLLAENKVLKAEIERLKNELAVKFTQPPPVVESELRRRRHSDVTELEEDEDARTMVEEPIHHQQDGVPLNVVVAISFAVFFTTYLFF